MMKKLILLFVLVPFVSFAKFYKGTVTMNDGSLKNGFIELPEYSDDAKLKFKNEENGKSEKLDIENIKGFDITNNKNQTIEFITIYLASQKPFTNLEFKIDSKKSWVRVLKEGKISLYSTYENYSSIITSSGSSIPGSVNGGSTSFYIKKGTDNYATFIDAIEGGANICGNCFSQMKKTISKILEKDCPKLADLLTKDDLKKNGYVRIVELYEQNCGK